MFFKNVFSDHLAQGYNFHQNLLRDRNGFPSFLPQPGRIINPCKNYKKFSRLQTKLKSIPGPTCAGGRPPARTPGSRAAALAGRREKADEKNTRGSLTDSRPSYLYFITSTLFPISSAWQTLSWWK